MPRPGVRWLYVVCICTVLLATGTRVCEARDVTAQVTFFESRIRPILVERCYKCHSAETEKPKGGLKLDTRDAIRKGGLSGPAVVPGNADESLLIQAIEHAGDVAKMPPKSKLPDEVIADFRTWIKAGAVDPRDGSARSETAAGRDWWSLKPLILPPMPVPPAEKQGWIRTPVDAFILAKQREKNLGPAPEADRRTLIRRLFFDLTGLPPTPEDVSGFLADSAPDAYERLVDRLLDSPRYGERWARHWMDLVHFAETHGHDQDRIRPNAWPYRDYLIQAFNEDKPYARFIQEQLAADVLFPAEPGLAVALGFIAAGPWDESSLRDIRDDSIDRQIGHYIDRDDMVSTAMSTFVSSTVHCARCHDHKFDPITQQDYYSLQAVFAGVDRANRAYDVDAKLGQLRRELNEKRHALQMHEKGAMDRLLDPAIEAEVASWEASLRSKHLPWTALESVELRSASGVTLTKEADAYIYSSGAAPPADTYTISAETSLRGITGVRLEVVPDDRLPAKGPGRAGNGNLHLTEFQLLAAPKGNAEAARPVGILAALADFEQDGWKIAHAIDGNPQTAWGIYPAVAKAHEAVFELKQDLGYDGGSRLTFVLQQTHPAGHLIGRLRLSVTTAPRPLRPGAIPDAIAKLIAVPQAERSREQKQQLAAIYLTERLDRQIAGLPPPHYVYAGASDFLPDAGHKPSKSPRPVNVLKRGDIHKPAEPASPGTMSCVDGLPARFDVSAADPEGLRRAALARWITDPKNPLTWRSIVNRIWHYHFGRGLVDTPNDFGRMGSLPTHPELLDWLAASIRDEGGSLKNLHRVIVKSATYRQSCRHDSNAALVDADNRLLWRMNRTRLDAESFRDAVLQITGRLDLTMGGPSVQNFALSPGVHVTPVVDYSKFDWDGPGAGRRSVYRFLFRTLPDPFMDSLDCADASQLTAARNVSVTPLQALALLNDRFVLRHSELFARRLETLSSDLDGRIRMAFELALGRPAESDELEQCKAYAAKHGLENVCRLILNSNEFLFIN